MRCWTSIVLVLAGCGSSSDDSPGVRPAGESLYFSKGCAACHGARGEGSFMGPPLSNVPARWKRDELARFIADPAPFVERDARLRELASAYRTPMKPSPMSETERAALADFLLSER